MLVGEMMLNEENVKRGQKSSYKGLKEVHVSLKYFLEFG
jgi:hypothetical protein